MNRDLTNNVEVVESIRPQVASGAVDGETVDLRGSDSVAFSVSVGAVTGTSGDSTIELEESDDASTWTVVSDDDIIGTEPTLAANTAYQFGYSGSERYVRAVFALGGETNVAVCVTAVKGDLSQAPADYSVSS